MKVILYLFDIAISTVVFIKRQMVCMRKFFLIAISLVVVFVVRSQDPVSTDTSKPVPKWKKGGTFSLNVGQGGSRNWAAGAEKFSFSTAAYLHLFANRTTGKFLFEKSLDLGYALVNTTTLGTRKMDDKIDFLSKTGYNFSKTLGAALLVNFRSQFYKGFDYNYLGKGLQRRTSAFFAPAYIIVAPGLDWHPKDYFSIYFSPVSVRFVVVTNQPKSYYFQGAVIPDSVKGPSTPAYETPLSVFYGVDPAREVRTEVGAFASVKFNKEVMKNVTYNSRLDLYSNYLKSYNFQVTGPDQLAITKTDRSPEKIDVFWTNLVVMKVNKFLNVTYNFDLIYDDDVKQFGPNKNVAAAQLRSLLAVGVAAKF